MAGAHVEHAELMKMLHTLSRQLEHIERQLERMDANHKQQSEKTDADHGVVSSGYRELFVIVAWFAAILASIFVNGKYSMW